MSKGGEMAEKRKDPEEKSERYVRGGTVKVKTEEKSVSGDAVTVRRAGTDERKARVIRRWLQTSP
jgi:translation initiation factor IF-1